MSSPQVWTVLARDTNEAHAVVRIDRTVVKVLRDEPRGWRPQWGTPAEQWRAREKVGGALRDSSVGGILLNDCRFDADAGMLVSPFVDGQILHPSEGPGLVRACGRWWPWLEDVKTANAIRRDITGAIVLVDFAIDLKKWWAAGGLAQQIAD